MFEKKEVEKTPDAEQFKKITKSDILRTAKDYTEHESETLKGIVEIRPLSDKEWQEIRGIQSKGIKLKGSTEEIRNKKGQVEIDTADLSNNAHKADKLAIKYCLKGDWTDEEIEEMKAGAIEELAQAIYELSGVDVKSMEKRMKSFR